MFVTHLSLADFRSYAGAEVALEPGVTTFTGANGQGKTNLVEAVDYLATLGSHRVSSEQPLVRHGAERAIVRARVQAGADDTRQLLLEIEILPGRQNKASLNRVPLRRPRELLGALRTVVFSPEDLALVKGDPSERRRFLDELITTRWPRLAGVRADYDRVLRQRSTLLKSLAGRGRTLRDDVEATLGVWDESLARFGAELMHARLDTLAALAPHVADAYSAIAPTNNDATLEYRCAIGAEVSTSQDEIEARLIMAMVMVESNFNPSAVSRAGAMGLGQLMPGTARGMGVGNAFDAHDNLYGTVRLIRGHMDKYRKQTGDEFEGLVLALAAYNAGSGAVSKHGGVPPYRETQAYVRKVITQYQQLCGGR